MNSTISKMLSFTDDMHKETVFSKLDYSREKTADFFERIIKDKQFLYLTNECLMIGRAGKTFFGDSVMASDSLLYVKKEYRGNGHAENAILKFIEWADLIGADSVTISQSSGICGKEFNALSEKCGLIKQGEVFSR